MENSDNCKTDDVCGICGESNNLRVIQEKFHKTYEEKLREICDSDKDGIISLQENWIANLTEQNCLFVDTVEKLEYEACERVKMLEEKLHKSNRYISEVMKKYIEHDFANDLLREPLEKVFYLENDQKSLLEFINRIRNNNEWTVNGLKFYLIDHKQLLGERKEVSNDAIEMESQLESSEKQNEQLQNNLKKCATTCDAKDALSKELKRCQDDYNSLKKSMQDMRNALTEEVAAKHDQMMALKRDCSQLEERCQTADKQLAFKDDIIKGLRKEIKQLKQQNNECCNRIEELGIRTEDLCKETKTLLCEKNKLCETINELKQSAGFASKYTQDEVQNLNATIDELQNNLSESKKLQEKEIKDYKSHINKLNEKVKELEEKLKNRSEYTEEQQKTYKICKICRGKSKVGFVDEQQTTNRESEMQKAHLQNKIIELENDLRNSEEKVRNLQVAVDYYTNSVKLLEETNENSKIKIEQQKITITNLQDGLLNVKHELDEYKHKYDEKDQEMNLSVINLTKMRKSNDYLQEMLYRLEIEHCKKLLDIEMLEKHLNNYKCLVKQAENDKIIFKEFFNELHEEMMNFVTYLNDLHTLIKISNENAQQEVRNLKQALKEMNEINKKLKTQLEAFENKSQQKNGFYEMKIEELKQILVNKDNDLIKHDQIVESLRKELDKTLNENGQLYENVTSLNKIVENLQQSIQKYEVENERNKDNKNYCMTQINTCRESLKNLCKSLEEKTAELCKLEKVYNNQCKTLCEIKTELDEEKMKQCHLKCTIEQLEDQLKKKEDKYNELYEEYTKIKQNSNKKDSQKDLEIKRYRKIVKDLKNTITDLNRNLSNKEIITYCTDATCIWKSFDNYEDDDEISCCKNCSCQYQLIGTLKQSINDLITQLDNTKRKYTESKSDLKKKQVQIEELTSSKSDEIKNLLNEYHRKVRLINDAEKRYQTLMVLFENEIVKIRDDIQDKTVELSNMKCNSNKMNCLEIVVTEEELNSLKNKLNSLLKKYCILSQENEQLVTRCSEIQANTSDSQLKQSVEELNEIKLEKETLIKKHLELLAELDIQCSCNNCQRYNLIINMKNQQYDQLFNNHNDICSESKNVCEYVKLWLEEQRNINKHIVNKQNILFDTIKKLQQTNEYWRKSSGNVFKNIKSSNLSCNSPCSLNSEGNTSICDSESPCRSPIIQWCSPTFKNESEDDISDNGYINLVEKINFLTKKARKANSTWKNAKDHK